MTLLEEIYLLIRAIFFWICLYVLTIFFVFTFGLKKISIFNWNIFIPIPSENSITVQVFNIIRRNFLPSGVELITTNPMSAFLSQITISLALGLLITLPVLLYSIISYIEPALLPREKRAIIWTIIPTVFLFLVGCLFSYFFLIPATFRVLYPFAVAMGAVPYFSIEEFIQYIFGLMFGVGVMFLLPLFMIMLSYLNIIDASFWIRKWRIALLFFLVLCAIITPDSTGITMIMLFIPLFGLYFAGYYFAKKFGS